ncbi:MAG: DUF6152 family protein [Caulobacteraceae bacterium]
MTIPIKGALRLAVLPAALLALAGPALAHHSFAMFDNEHQTKIEGTVTKFEWTNPHVYIQLALTEPDGKVRNYAVECANPGILNRVGWKFNVVKPGDKVKLVVAPLRDDPTAGGLLHEMVLPDGKVLSNGGFAGAATVHF